MRYADHEQRQLDIQSGLELDRNAARKHQREAQKIGPRRFPLTYCSQCGREFGPGNHGFSHGVARIKRENITILRRGRGQNVVRFVVWNQSFDLDGPMNATQARWCAGQLAIALAKFRFDPVC